jgi:hypothetical protein
MKNSNFGYEYAQFLLNNIPSARSASGGREINCRCFYCPDSRNPKHAHFYIKIPQTNEESSTYYCQLCGERGFVDHTKLLEWGVWDDNIALDLIEHNKNVKSVNKDSKLSVYKLSNRYVRDEDVSRIKLDYINDRIGTSYTYDDLFKLKIALNLRDLLDTNHVNDLTRNPNIVDQLDLNFLGFISIDNAFLNMRRVCNEGLVHKSIDKRYINYNIFNKFDTSHRFYTIPTSVDLSKIPVNIHIAEGPFDILSIYENVRHREPGIYTSIGGSNYIGIVYYFLITFKIPIAVIHIYPDNDNIGNNRKMEYIHRKLKDIGIQVIMHRNMYPGEKDFGVRPDHIDEKIINIEDLFI